VRFFGEVPLSIKAWNQLSRRWNTIAALVAKYRVVDTRLSQSAYAISDHLVHSDPLVERFESDNVIFRIGYRFLDAFVDARHGSADRS